MTTTPGDDKCAAATGARELARARALTKRAEADLLLLRQQMDTQNRTGERRDAQLVEANEHLLCSALSARIDADACSRALQEMSRSLRLDALTELPNRVLLLDRFAQAIAHAHRHGTRLALLFLDIDNFKQVNDTFGHAFGDEALRLAARRLIATVRDVDTVRRHGGDE